MINLKIECVEERYFISELLTSNNKRELPAKYIKIFIYVFGNMKRLPRLSKLFEYLVDTDSEIVISEYDLIQMIKILYSKGYNLPTGNWLIEYYQDIYEYAHYELGKILPD